MKYDTDRVIMNTLIEDVIKAMGVRKEEYAVIMGVTVSCVYNWLNNKPVNRVMAEKITKQAQQLGLDPRNYKPSSVPLRERLRVVNKNGIGWDLDKLK